MPTDDVLADLEARGLVHLTTDRDALAARLAEGPIAAYYGCDPTADSLHVGNLIGLLILRRLRDAGHRVVALAGGATGLVGDPSERSDERNLLDPETLDANTAAISAQIARVVDPTGEHGTVLVDNREWTEDLTLLEFLRRVGSHATVNQMLARDSVRARLESDDGISFMEFTYMLLQAHDYLHLHDHHGVDLQIGGSDQWGNIVSGVDLVRRVRGHHVHALCWPLLTAPDGTKLGKTTGARTWLSAERTSPYQLFQHFVQLDDAEVDRQLRWFTLLPVTEIEALVEAHREDPSGRRAQRALAREVTTIVHGDEAAAAAEELGAWFFADERPPLTEAALAMFRLEAPTATFDDLTPDGPRLSDLFRQAGLVSSRSDFLRHLGTGLRLNDELVAEDRPLTEDDLVDGRYAVLRRGKKTHALVTWSASASA